MSREKDPHKRERDTAYFFGGARVPLRYRPSIYSRSIDHPWMEITHVHNKDIKEAIAKYIQRPYVIRSDGKLSITAVTSPGTNLYDSVVLVRAGDFMEWFGGGGWHGREYRDLLERERVERESGPTHDETEFLGWAFNR